jgi:hypothetical protein
MTTNTQLAELLGKNAELFAAYGRWSDGQIMLLAGTIDDPDSFDKDGGKAGALGFYPVVNVNGQTIYVPCMSRLAAIAAGSADPGALETLLGKQVTAALEASGQADTFRQQAGTSAAAAAATVPTMAADVDGVPWVHHDGLTLTGLAAGLAWTDSIRTVARAVKHVLLEGAVAAGETYYLSTLCYEDQQFGDQIIVRRASDNAAVALSGTGVIAKAADAPTEVSFLGGGIRIRLLIDYRELTKGVLVNSARVTPLLISRAVSPVERDRTNRHQQLRGSLWLEPDAVGLVGAASSYIWDASSRTLARAIKDVVLSGVDPLKRYRIYQVANGHVAGPNDPAQGDRIRIVDEATQQSVLDSTTAAAVTRNPSGITRVELSSGGISAAISIDYRELTAGTNYAVASNPLLVARQTFGDVLPRRSALPRVRNIALDPAGALGKGVFQGAGALPALADANADLVASGIVKSHPFGTNTTATAFYKRELVQGRPNGRVVFASVYVYSASGADWPGNLALYAYSAAAGGAIVAGVAVLEKGYDQVTATKRRYRARVRLPAAGAIGSIVYGFDSVIANSSAEVGGWTFAISDADLNVDTVALDDWTGWSTRDAWRDGVDGQLTSLAGRSPAVRARNLAYNPTLANAGQGTRFQGGGTIPAPAAANAELTARGVVNSHAIGTNSTATSIYKRDDAVERPNGLFGFASVYVYSASGAAWPGNVAIFPYPTATGGAIVPGTVTIGAGYDQVTPNLRRYWNQFQLPAAGTILSVAYGFNGIVSGSAAEAGGWSLSFGVDALSVANVQPDDWTGWSTRNTWRDNVDATLAGAATLATAAPKLRAGDKPWVNVVPNPNLDPAEAAATWIGGNPVLTVPASAEMVRRGILRAVQIGTGGNSARLRADNILDASASGQFYFASTYAYAADGATWPAPVVYWYAGGTLAGGRTMSNYLQLDANTRFYYEAGQLPVRADLTQLRLGTLAGVLGTVAQVGGFGFVTYNAALTIDDIVRDEWYPQATRRDSLIKIARQAAAGGGLPFAGETWVMFGDSITDSFGVPEQVAIRGGATVVNGGFGGCRWTPGGSTAGMAGAQAQFSMARLAQAVASGDWSAQIKAADDAFAIDPTYDKRAKVAALAAVDWSKVTRITLDWGTNDWSAGRALGDPNSAAENEVNGAINLAISRIQAKYPAVQIVLITPWWRGPNATLGDSNINPNANGLMLRDMQDAIVARGRYHQVPVIRMHELVGINLGNKALLLGDDLHPTQAGRDRKAKVVVNKMRVIAA